MPCLCIVEDALAKFLMHRAERPSWSPSLATKKVSEYLLLSYLLNKKIFPNRNFFLQISANVYLIALTTADSVFLLGLLLILFKLDFVAYHFCVVIEYILATSSYISSWSIAALTIERYLAIAYPLKHVMVPFIVFAFSNNCSPLLQGRIFIL